MSGLRRLVLALALGLTACGSGSPTGSAVRSEASSACAEAEPALSRVGLRASGGALAAAGRAQDRVARELAALDLPRGVDGSSAGIVSRAGRTAGTFRDLRSIIAAGPSAPELRNAVSRWQSEASGLAVAARADGVARCGRASLRAAGRVSAVLYWSSVGPSLARFRSAARAVVRAPRISREESYDRLRLIFSACRETLESTVPPASARRPHEALVELIRAYEDRTREPYPVYASVSPERLREITARMGPGSPRFTAAVQRLSDALQRAAG